jgi:hypothetical protein
MRRGEYEIGKTAEDAATNLLDNHGAFAMRTVCLNLTMAAPEVQSIDGAIPDDAGTTVSIEPTIEKAA